MVREGTASLTNETVKRRFGRTVEGWLITNSRAYNYLHYYVSIAKYALRSRDRGGEASDGPTPDAGPEQVALTFVLEKLRDLCATHEVPLYVATPFGEPRPAKACAELGIPLIDVKAYLDAHRASSEESTVLGNDPHWSAVGNRVVARGLQAELEKLRSR